MRPRAVGFGEHPAPVSIGNPRLPFIDNIRWAVIILVVSMHAADTYSPLGNWYFTDRVKLGTATLLAFAWWQMLLQSFFMGLLFFIAGLFVPRSFDRKGPSKFLKDRAIRLGVPVLFYMLWLGPITEYYASHSWSATNSSFAREWWHHIVDLEVLSESGPLWFCLALLIFSAAYTVLRPWPAKGPHREPIRSTPTTSTFIRFALAMAAMTFVIRLALPENYSAFNMHPGDFSQYVLLFGAGIWAARTDLTPKLSWASGVRWLVLTLTVGMAAWMALLIAGGALRGNTAAFSGGWYWQSAALNLWESFSCVGLCFGILVLFREKFNTQSRITRFLADNAFSVYVFHPPVVILAARILVGAPVQPFLKFLLVTGFSVIVTFALSALVIRRIPVLRTMV